jgi:hypothetical protein
LSTRTAVRPLFPRPFGRNSPDFIGRQLHSAGT